MSGNVGVQANTTTINNNITGFAINLRGVMQQISYLSTFINGQGTGLATLAEIGFSTAASSINPGGISDAQYALNMISYLNTVAGVYYGTAAQPTTFNFDQELSQMWAGQ
jgi:hypothetical protein